MDWISLEELLLNWNVDLKKLKRLIDNKELAVKAEERNGKTVYFVENSKKLLRVQGGRRSGAVPDILLRIMESFIVGVAAGVTSAKMLDLESEINSIEDWRVKEKFFLDSFSDYIYNELDNGGTAYDSVLPLKDAVAAVAVHNTRKRRAKKRDIRDSLIEISNKFDLYFIYIQGLSSHYNTDKLIPSFPLHESDDILKYSYTNVVDLFHDAYRKHDQIAMWKYDGSGTPRNVAAVICGSTYIDRRKFESLYYKIITV